MRNAAKLSGPTSATFGAAMAMAVMALWMASFGQAHESLYTTVAPAPVAAPATSAALAPPGLGKLMVNLTMRTPPPARNG